jgi:hypothetical protein
VLLSSLDLTLGNSPALCTSRSFLGTAVGDVQELVELDGAAAFGHGYDDLPDAVMSVA